MSFKRIFIIFLIIIVIGAYLALIDKRYTFLVWNNSNNAITVGNTVIYPAPKIKSVPHPTQPLNFYATIKEPIQSLYFELFDVSAFKGIERSMPGIEVLVHSMGRTFTLGCPIKYKGDFMNLMLVKKARRSDKLIALCMPMKMDDFLQRYPENQEQWPRESIKSRDKYANRNKRVAVYSASHTKDVHPKKSAH